MRWATGIPAVPIWRRQVCATNHSRSACPCVFDNPALWLGCDLNTVTELYKHLIKDKHGFAFLFLTLFSLWHLNSVLGEIGSWSPSPHVADSLLDFPAILASDRFRDGQATAKPTLPQGFCLSRAECGTTSRRMLLSPPGELPQKQQN